MIAPPDQANQSAISTNRSAESKNKFRSLLESFRLPLLFIAHGLLFALIYWSALFVRFERFLSLIHI